MMPVSVTVVVIVESIIHAMGMFELGCTALTP